MTPPQDATPAVRLLPALTDEQIERLIRKIGRQTDLTTDAPDAREPSPAQRIHDYWEADAR